MDDGVGRFLRGLDDLAIADHTLVVFATDHGAAMPRAKCTLYDPGIEVALLWRWPNFLPAGRVVRDIVSNVDVTPSLLDALGLPVPAAVQGRSFWPLLAGDHYVARDEIFAEKTFHTYYEPMRSVRTLHPKLIATSAV